MHAFSMPKNIVLFIRGHCLPIQTYSNTRKTTKHNTLKFSAIVQYQKFYVVLMAVKFQSFNEREGEQQQKNSHIVSISLLVM